MHMTTLLIIDICLHSLPRGAKPKEAKMDTIINLPLENRFIVDRIAPVSARETYIKQDKRKKKRDKKRHYEAAGNHFDSLAKAAERAHEILERNNSPFRFCVYRESNDVFIDLAILNNNGKIKDIIKKDITHQEFSIWLDRIEKRDGLLLDAEI
jgi:hypothetical protein